MKEAIKEIVGNETNDGKMIMQMLKNLKELNLKQSEDDEEYHFNNIGFYTIMLHDEIREKYEKYKKKANCEIYS